MNPLKTLATKLLGMGGGQLMEGAGKLMAQVDDLSIGEGEKAEMRAKLMEKLIDSQIVSQQNVNAEISSTHWLAANWRPLLAVQWGFILTYTYWFGPMLNLPVVDLDSTIYNLLVICLTGYGSLRTVEKVAGKVIPYYTAKQLRKLAKAGIEGEPNG